MNFMKLPVLRHGLMIRHEEILPDERVADRLEVVRRIMAEEDVQALVAYSDAVRTGPVCYLTNYPCYGLGRRAVAVLGEKEGPFLFTAEPSRNLPRVRQFTTCDLERARRYLPAALERARSISRGRSIGLVGFGCLSHESLKEIEKELAEYKTKDLTERFVCLLASKDESSLRATRIALGMAKKGVQIVADEALSGKSLWAIAAYVDYRLRLLGCEDTNVLVSCSNGSPLRPGYPGYAKPAPDDNMLAIVAVQYARHWGVAGGNITLRYLPEALQAQQERLNAVKDSLTQRVKSGMLLDEVVMIALEEGEKMGTNIARDLPLVSGIGFDLSEYPNSPGDRIEDNTVLQFCLAADGDRFTAMTIGMLLATSEKSLWLEP